MHYGHVGRDELFRKALEIWWIFTQRDAMVVKSSKDFQGEGKSFQTILHQIYLGKLLTLREIEEEFSIDLAGLFRVVRDSEKLFSVSSDHETGWHEATFLR